MDTSSSYIVDNTELQTLILASIQTLKRNNKKCGTEEVFQLVLESLDSDIDKESFDKILEFLIKNQKVKTSCYANKTCLSRSSLISNTSARHERHECNTSDKNATRVRH